MATHELSKQALAHAFQEAAEHFSELGNLEQKLTQARYQDQELLGEGGAKLVYLTHDQVTGRKLARAYPKSVEMEEDFLREATLHAQLEHPNIVPFYDMGLEGESPFFCMKRIRGDTLEQYVMKHQGELSWPVVRNELLDAFLKVCDAVSYAHAHDVLHLDLKPSNIQLSSYGEVLVGDWGLARVSYFNDHEANTSLNTPSEQGIQSTGQFTRHGYLSGTPGFMAPEQCVKGSEKTERSDVYALGALLVFILTGEQPITGKCEEVIAATIRGSWTFSMDSIPQGLRAVVRKALAADPSDRYLTVKELLSDINAYRSGFLTSAEGFSSKRMLQKIYHRNKTTSHITAVSLLALIAITTIFIHSLKSSEQNAQRARGVAVEEQKKTQEALELFQRAQKEKRKQEKTFASNYLKESIGRYYTTDRGRYTYFTQRDENAYQLVNKALSLEPDNLESWALKGRLAMLTGRMNEAQYAFQRCGDGYKIHSEVCSEYADRDLRDVHVLAEMLWQLVPSNDLRLIHDFMFKTIFSDLPQDQMIYFIEQCLNLRNPGVPKRLHFEYRPETQSLDLSRNAQLHFIFAIKNLPLREINLSYTSVGDDLMHLLKMPLVKVNVAHSGMNDTTLKFLTGRPIRELILTGCKVSDLSPLRDSPLETIDVRDTQVEDFSPLASIPELQQVICTATQRPLLQETGIMDSQILVKSTATHSK